MMKNQGEQRLVPKLRFKGFSEDWEQRELGEHLEKVRSYPISRSQETQNITNVKYIHYGDIHVNIAEYINQNTKLPYIIENEKYESLKIGDLIFADASEDKDGIAKASFISRDKYDFNIVGGTHTIATRPNQSIVQSEFIYFFSKTNRFRKYAMKMATGTKIYGITYSNLAKMAIASPLNTEEQKKIIKMISNIETLVTLHKRKIQVLKDQKNLYLNKMFISQQGDVPLRFKGFTEPWEQYKVGKISKSFSGGTPRSSESDFYHGNIPFIRSGEINSTTTEIFITEEGLSSSSAKIVEKGNLLYAMYGATSGEVAISKITGAINQAILAIILNENHNKMFLYYYLSNNKNRILHKYLQGGQGNLSANIIKNINVKIPQNPRESIKISEFISSIDNMITLHNKKLNKLESLKKEYLNYLFI